MAPRMNPKESIMSLRRALLATRVELALATRNRMVVYTLIAPLVMALLFRMLFPLFTEARVALLVPESLPRPAQMELARHGDLTVVADEQAVQERVAREDDALGIVPRGDRLTVLRFGNERAAAVELAQTAALQAQAALEGRPPARPLVERYQADQGVVRRWQDAALSLLALFGVVAGMLAVAFSLMEDRAQRTQSYLSITPLSPGEYLVGKSAAGGLLAAVTTPLTLGLAGASPHWGQAALATLAGVPLAAGLGLLLGLGSRSEVQLIAYIKGVATLLMVAPVAGVLLPSRWQPTLYWAPTYWLSRGFQEAVGLGAWTEVLTDCGVAVAMGMALTAVARRRVAQGTQATRA